MIFRELDIVDYPEYDLFIKNNKQALFFHSIKYLNLLRDVTNSVLKIEALYISDSLKAVFPYFIKDGTHGKVVNSGPFYGSHGGVLYSERKFAQPLADYFYKKLSFEGIGSITVVSNLYEEGCKYKSNLIDSRIGQVTNIEVEGDAGEELMKGFHYKTRNMIRKGIKSNVQVHIANDSIEELYDMHFSNMVQIGGVAKPKYFFEKIPHYFEAGKDYKIFRATINGEYAGSLLLFYFNNVVEYFTPVINQEYRSVQPMSVLIFEAMTSASLGGFKFWNWGGTWGTQDGVYRFKSRWNANDYEYKYYIKLINDKILRSDQNTLLDSYPFFFVVPFDKLLE